MVKVTEAAPAPPSKAPAPKTPPGKGPPPKAPPKCTKFMGKEVDCKKDNIPCEKKCKDGLRYDEGYKLHCITSAGTHKDQSLN
ncbi:hypothetical protein QVD17_07872 [Tagetes erecta]|uniref:Uncharacterized protein n=1 Tax=Tagetes erecta TaxID=13708 RepID=A0AAD8KYP9_TARER|nr:hypothetical protein QVD17_07872 [Tagetes erecta]